MNTHFIFSCLFFPSPLLLAQVQGCQQVPEAWVLAARSRLLQTFLASLKTRLNPSLPASSHKAELLHFLMEATAYRTPTPGPGRGWDRPSWAPPARRG